MTTQEITIVTCPQCQARYETSITSIIDIDQDPALKHTFLRDEINNSQCPQCGFTGELSVPVIYHDGSKELALVFSPSALGVSRIDVEKMIGSLTNKLINSLPAEKRKAYLFTPQTFLTLDSLKKAILEADGITEEVLQAQSAKIQLLQRMLRATDQANLKELVEQHDADLDQQFFEILSSMAFEALAANEQERAQSLLGFRHMVAELSSRGTELIAEIDKRAGFQPMNADTLLEMLKNATDEEELIDLIRQGKPLIDYTFFQRLTGQIDALTAEGNQAEAEKLKALRSRILDISAKVEEENRKIISRVTKLIDELIKASDQKKFILDRLNEFDEAFFSILAAHIQESKNRGQKEVAEKLTGLHNQILSVMQEQIPPELKLLNELFQLTSPEMIKSKLEQNRALITPKFLTLLDQVKVDIEKQGNSQLLSHLEIIKKEAEAAKQGGIILMP